MTSIIRWLMESLPSAEFRGPGVHHRFEDSEEYDADLDHRNTRRPTGPSGQVILLGDGNDPHDSEMFDHDEEDRDLSAQVGTLEPWLTARFSAPDPRSLTRRIRSIG